MKTIKITLMILLTTALLVGCNDKPLTVTTCEGIYKDFEGAVHTIEYTSHGDVLIGFKTTQVYPYEYINDYIDFITDFEENSRTYEDSENVEYTYENTNDSIVETTVIKDLHKATKEELQFVNLTFTDNGFSKISLKETIEDLESKTNLVCDH